MHARLELWCRLPMKFRYVPAPTAPRRLSNAVVNIRSCTQTFVIPERRLSEFLLNKLKTRRADMLPYSHVLALAIR
jgi:hypothetical protein